MIPMSMMQAARLIISSLLGFAVRGHDLSFIGASLYSTFIAPSSKYSILASVLFQHVSLVNPYLFFQNVTP
jgi:hypothetical protein